MRSLALTTTILCSTPAIANSPVSYEYRDLDGDTRTVEAVFDAVNFVTWLTDTNVGLTQTFGIERGNLSDYYSRQINPQGLMTQDTAVQYIDSMNANNYLGFSQWRLPRYAGTPDADCSEQFNGGQVVFGRGCTAPEVGSFNRDVFQFGALDEAVFENLDGTARWVGSTGPSGGLYYYQFGDEGNLDFCPGGDGICNTAFVWPVLDGDVGTPIVPVCEDSDGDGYGWNGFSSCTSAAPVQGACVDTIPQNDGWGWNGVESCVLPAAGEGFCQSYGSFPWGWNNTTQTSCRLDEGVPPVAGDCIDTVPLNDGWGWNGAESCRVPATGAGFCQSYGDYPWGWNNTTQTSCRLDEG